ncbi:MAG: UDP-N-acetylglucosamine 2-epimerase (non-hydrolyzing) [Betaproteobacteria bacterium]|nr:UDP-N-acetylglucosamine 2-epimerase (non-hydrolyzing) [Betaproteobacteria bacterium]NBP37976.1 UDP-N-acetylglucosamine 2-epimerase (non-hydrolyzing) [Betaproteobacteria bacterium]NBQ79102.1 UDP-N-acetylglucosamine 2-epimerase (non-hydrolyzing) [Betaproteobacteria bacterium]NBS39714.1 UDP-N-acetylglucosamine 2-epimerase (non-hydrolyzing) [Betaproteobacteria bacterium]NBT05268.1 UDP-N-acetylglucosamine 2-epimerase (non-hydrolyzing) [Betaproteobacteria bacterium]
MNRCQKSGDLVPIMVLIGTRPEAIKLAPVIEAFRSSAWARPQVVLTGQHSDLIDPLVESFGLEVHHHLRVMQANQSLASVTGRILERLDQLLLDQQPVAVIGQGDTASVLAGSMASFFRSIPFAHVEAGLRTGNLLAPFPEELNRVLTSKMTQWHFAPTETAKRNLVLEAVPESRIWVTGNTVIDALKLCLARHNAFSTESIQNLKPNPPIASVFASGNQLEWTRFLESNREMVLITAHRRENFGPALQSICRAILELASRYQDHDFVYPVHPNPQVRDVVGSMLVGLPNVFLMPPADYPIFCLLMQKARLILSDSGGVQEEAPALGTPVLVLREETERPEAVRLGCNRLVGTDTQRIVDGVETLFSQPEEYRAMANAGSPYGDGLAAQRIEAVLRDHFA